MRVHQLLSGAGPFDAITTEALEFRSWFRRWGWGGGDHAARLAPGVDSEIAPLSALAPDSHDVLLLHHSAGAPQLDELLARPNPKLLLYHNITPASWLWNHAPLVAVHCAIGREQLPQLVRAVDVAAADSEFNAAELRELGAERPEVIPLLLNPERLGGSRNGARAPDPQAPALLFVGRLSPHKRQDELIRAFSLYRRYRAPGATLTLVGDPITPGYRDWLRRLAHTLSPGAVSIESGLSESELAERYRSADVFVCLSEHEGFCIPILEAFRFSLPVIARPVGAVPQVAGDAALLVEDHDLGVISELVHLAVVDQALRQELARRGHEQLERFSADEVAARLRAAVERAAAAAR